MAILVSDDKWMRLWHISCGIQADIQAAMVLGLVTTPLPEYSGYEKCIMEAERAVLCDDLDAVFGRGTSSPDHKSGKIDILLNSQPTLALCPNLCYHKQSAQGDI